MSLRPRLVRHCRPSMTQLFEQQPSLYSPSPTPGGSAVMSDQKSEEYCSNSSVLTDKAEVGGGGDSSGDDRTFDEAVFDLLKVNAEEIARQITLLDLQLFKAIQPDELTSCAWTQTKYKNERAYNIVQSTRRFNHINFWVQREILSQEDIQKRAQVLGQFIKICRKLMDMNNLQSAMSILAALQSAAIHRLERTWAAITKHQRATYEKLSDLFSEANNRQRLRDHMASLKLPCIPYLGLYLSDLTYIDVAHPSTGGIESQARQDKMNNILRVIADFQQSSYPFTRKDHVRKYILGQQYIEELQKFVEDGNFKLSKQLEPPATPPSSCGVETVVTSLKPSHLVDPAGARNSPVPTGAATINLSCANDRGLSSLLTTSTPNATCRIGRTTPEPLVNMNLALTPSTGTSNVELRPQRINQPPKSHRKSKSLDNKDLFGSFSDSNVGLIFANTPGRPQLLRHPLDDSLLVGQTPPAVPRFQLHAAVAAVTPGATTGVPLSQSILSASQYSNASQCAYPSFMLDSKHLRSCGIDGPAASSDLASSPDSATHVDTMVPAIAGSVDLDKASISMGSVEGLVNGRGMAGLMSMSTGSGAATSVSSAVVVDAEIFVPSPDGLMYPGETMPEVLDARPTICEGCLKRKTLMKVGKRQSQWKMWRRLWVRLIEHESLYYLLYYRPRRSFSYGTDREEFREEVHMAQCLRKTLVSLEGEDNLGAPGGLHSSPVSATASPAVSGSAGTPSPNPSPARTASFSSRHRFSIPFSHARQHHQLTLKVNDLLRQNSHTFRKVGRGGVSLEEWHGQLSRSIREMEDAIERRDLIQLHDS